MLVDEADGRVEGEVRRNGRLVGRIERQHGLEAHQGVKDQEAGDVEEQHGHRVGQPMLLALLVDAADPVQRRLNRPKHRGQECALALEDARHVAAERHDERGENREIDRDLNPAD